MRKICLLVDFSKAILKVHHVLFAGCSAANTSTGEECVSREELEAVSQELASVKTRLSSQANATGRLYLLDNPGTCNSNL